jgi:hypothetical protein
MQKPKRKGKMLVSEGKPKVFIMDKEASKKQLERLELNYLVNQLRDPSALASRLELKQPKKDTKKIIKSMALRAQELMDQLVKDSKKKLGSDEALANYEPLLWPESDSTGSDFKGSNPIDEKIALYRLLASHQDRHSIPLEAAQEEFFSKAWKRRCDIRNGVISEPSSFRKGELDWSAPTTDEGEGNIAYRIDTGVLPFIAKAEDHGEETSFFVLVGELSYTFPAPTCDSFLFYKFDLYAGAGVTAIGEKGGILLDTVIGVQPDISEPPPVVHFPVRGNFYAIKGPEFWRSAPTQTYDGVFDIDAHKQGRLWVGLVLTIVAHDAEVVTEGLWHLWASGAIHGFWASPSPGVQYVLYPHP